MSENIFSFTITVARQGNAIGPRNEREAVRLIGVLLEQGNFLEVLDMRRADGILVGKEVI